MVVGQGRRGLPRYAGHPAGVESVRKLVEHCVQQGIEVLTLFAFSSDKLSAAEDKRSA